MSKLIEFSSRKEAEAFAAKVDAAMGYPAIGEGVCQAVPVGGGRHATHPACCTERHANVIEGKASWAYPIDADVAALDDADVVAEREVKVELQAASYDRQAIATAEQALELPGAIEAKP
jgi:hypothetical protein